MKKKYVGSEKLIVGILLTIIGGFMDGYTYMARGGVFANAQTGNIVKLGITIYHQNFESILLFMIPILSFIVGIFVTLILEEKLQTFHFYKRSVVLMEILVFLVVSQIPINEIGNIFANTCISFVMAMQMEAFKSFEGMSFTTTVSTGNLRKAIECLFKRQYQKTFSYLRIIILFIFGAYLGCVFTGKWNQYSILLMIIPSLSCFFVITQNKIQRVGTKLRKK